MQEEDGKENLPEELKNQLKQMSMTEKIIIELMKNENSTITIDEMLIKIYKKFNVILERRGVYNIVRKMVRRKLIVSTPKKHGVYQLKRDTE